MDKFMDYFKPMEWRVKMVYDQYVLLTSEIKKEQEKIMNELYDQWIYDLWITGEISTEQIEGIPP